MNLVHIARRIGGPLLAFALALVGPAPARASDGNQLFAFGAIQKGTAGSGIAAPKDASWALLNPASLVELDARADFWFELLFNEISSHPRGNPLVANPFAGEMEISSVLPVPSFAAAVPLKHGTLGFGAFGAEGNKADFPNPRTTLSLFKNGDRRSLYQVVKLPIAYGLNLESGWALGASLIPVGTRFATDSITLRFQPTVGGHEWRYAFGIGAQVGVHRRWERLSIGASYATRVWMQDYKDYQEDLVTANFDLPQKLQAGLAYRLRDNLEWTLDYKWIDWSSTKIMGENTYQGGLGWKNHHIYKTGLTWDINETWALRGGVAYGKSPIRAEHVFANALSPALAEWHFALGGSYQYNKRHGFHWSLVQTLPETATDNGEGDIFSLLGRGTRTRYSETSFTAQYSFAF